MRILDGIGDLHPCGDIVLITHASCVQQLKDSCRHGRRMRTAYFGAIRGRNDLEGTADRPVACHIVVGSPKTTEEDRRRVALAVYGESILPFAELQTVSRGVAGCTPAELIRGREGTRRMWEVRIKGYADPRMQAVYHHTVTAELTHAADRARVLVHSDAVVYLLTNEPVPQLWFAEQCFAADLLDLSGPERRSDYRRNYATYEAATRKLLDAGSATGNAAVCRALGRNPSWGVRYWREFLKRHADALQGQRKVRWKAQ